MPWLHSRCPKLLVDSPMISIRESLSISLVFLFAVAPVVPGSSKAKKRGTGTELGLTFSHKKHAHLGMECNVCHSTARTGNKAGFPSVRDCMSCHEAIKTESPKIQALQEFAREKKPIEWNRIYTLPSFVFFSHRRHAESRTGCEDCHGPVLSRDVLRREKDISMKACIACHRSKKASVACDLCHHLSF